MTPLLISLPDFAPYKAISVNTPADRLEPLIRAAQDIDLKKILGDNFYAALIAEHPGYLTYADLVNGINYVKDGRTVMYAGIKPVLVFFTEARRLAKGNMQDTPFGFNEKQNPFSTGVSTKQLQMEIEQARNDANSYARDMVNFLNWKKSQGLYPLWDDCRIVKARPRIRINKIGE